MKTSQALRYHEYGKPGEVLKLENVETASPGTGEVLIGLLASVINPSDFGMILGKYGSLKSLPATAGREGVAEVLEVGPGVTGLQAGDRVRFPESAGVWQTHAVVPAKDLSPVPKDCPVDFGAMAFINPPTAYRILEDYGLKEGDWIIQNAATSSVGLFLIQLACQKGIRTINLVRKADERAALLQELGADVVLEDNDEALKSLNDLTGGRKPRVALNSVGGESAIRMVKVLDKGGVHITIGAADFSSIRFPTRDLIFNQIRLEGFWLDLWQKTQSPEKNASMMKAIFEIAAKGHLQAPVAGKYSLSEFQAALKANSQPRVGKILLVP